MAGRAAREHLDLGVRVKNLEEEVRRLRLHGWGEGSGVPSSLPYPFMALGDAQTELGSNTPGAGQDNVLFAPDVTDILWDPTNSYDGLTGIYSPPTPCHVFVFATIAGYWASSGPARVKLAFETFDGLGSSSGGLAPVYKQFPNNPGDAIGESLTAEVIAELPAGWSIRVIADFENGDFHLGDSNGWFGGWVVG